MKKLAIVYLVLVVLVVVGEIKCIIKAFQCNWEPIGKAEIIYTGSSLTGLDAVVGWMDIEDK